MKNLKHFLFLFIISSSIIAQNNWLSIRIIDSETSKPVQDATLLLKELQIMKTSDANGYIKVDNLPIGKFFLTFSRIGYKSKTTPIQINDNKNRIKITLERKEILIGESLVTSTRNIRIIKDVPLPIEYINSERVENSIKISSSDIMENAPGVSLVSDGAWATGVNVRGLSKQNVVYLVDGNRIETSASLNAALSLIDINNIKNIEIVKGGLSSLYGTGATGGVINITTTNDKLSNKFIINGSIVSSYSNVNDGKTASINLGASNYNWFANITTTIREANDTKIPSGNLTNSGFRDKSISFASGYYPKENIELKFNYQNFRANDVGIPGGSPFPSSAKASYKYANRELFSGELSIKQISRTFTKLKIKYFNQIIEREVELIPNPNALIVPRATHTTNGFLLQTDWTLSKNNFLISGVEAWERSYKGDRKKYILPLNKIIVDKPVPNSKFSTLGFFINDELFIMEDKIKLNLGGRYDFIRVTNEKTNNPVEIITDGVSVIPTPDSDASYSAYDVKNKSWSGNLGILYKLNNILSLTFNSAYTFRSPSLEERYQYINLGSTIYYGNPNLEPEHGFSFDFGIRLWDDKFTFTADIFSNYLNNLVIDKMITDSSYQKQNVGAAKLFGFDSQLEYNFYRNHILYFNLAFVNGMDTNNDEYLPQIPPLNGKLGVKLPIANYFKIDLSSTFCNKQDRIAPDENITESYIYFDLLISSGIIEIFNLKLNIFTGIDNIFNKEYRNHLSTYRGISLTEPGRNIYAKIRLSW